MRLDSLRIRNFRGIRELELSFNGQNVAILGPNGTGKSSIIDAIDFLLRGGIRRLEGEGAGELSLTRHAPFIGSSAADAWVEGTFKLVGGARQTLRRAVDTPEQITSSTPLLPEVQRALILARDGGHHLLTRRELLRFVFTEPASRARAVGVLLQLDGIESTRKHLQGAARDAADALRREESQVRVLEQQMGGIFDPPLSRGETAHGRANSLRKTLGGEPIEFVQLDDATRDLATPSEAAIHPLHSPRTQAVLRALSSETISALNAGGLSDIRIFVEELASFAADTEKQKLLRESQLVELGLSLLDKDSCPLCRHPQDVDLLRSALTDRATASLRAREQLASLQVRRQELHESFSSHLQRVNDAIGAIADRDDLPSEGLSLLRQAIIEVVGRVLTPIEHWDGHGGESIGPLTESLAAADEDIAALRMILRGLPAPSRLQSAWDQLVQLSRATTSLSTAKVRLRLTRRVADSLQKADRKFLEARDGILQNTYESVASSMSDVYRSVHGDDESQFEAEMEPTRAGLKLAVEFRGKGRFPPAALHSEGHQDSMGLAFFLALSSHLAGAGLPIVLLDDVVMSVDYGHRRGVADMLCSRFGDRQIIITTHDRVWWRQLRSARVVSGKQSFEIARWSLEQGVSLTMTSVDSLGAARSALQRGSVVEAAVSLRRAVEECFPEYCDALGASVRFRADGAYEAGEFLQAAISRLKDLVAKARQSKRAWRQDESLVNNFDERRAEACRCFEGEAWLVNPTLHYNQWTANMSAADFLPVLSAYESLFELFECSSCRNPMFVVFEGKRPLSLRCPCEARNWNLAMPEPG